MNNTDSRSDATKIVRKNRRHSNFFKDLFEDYCSNTTLHGIHYLGAQDKNWFEKLWWLIVFAISLIVCLILINRTWIKWVNNPVIVSFNQEQTPIWEIPFPAVTICPINKVNKTHYNYTEKLLSVANLSREEYKKFWDIVLVCALGSFQAPSSGANNITDEEVVDNISDVSPKLSSIINYVIWSSKTQDRHFFSQQLTEDGICFTSNALSQKDMFTDNLNHNIKYMNHNRNSNGWTMEHGFSSESGSKTYPRRTARDSVEGGLSVTLITKWQNLDHVCGMPTFGYKLMFHNPAEIAWPRQQYILVPFDKEVIVSVTPQLITTSPGLLTTPPHTRKCFFAHERYLHFFKIYTQKNCQMECLANTTLKFCGCVPFYLPRGNDTPICGYGSLECLSDMLYESYNYDIEKHESSVKYDKMTAAFETSDRCDCMPSCHSLRYSVESSQAEMFASKAIEILNVISDGILGEHTGLVINGEAALTQVDIFFRDTQFLALRRTELYGQTDFVASCGGILGLFLGFSFLSLMEIVYFLTIRVWFKLKYRKIEQANITFVQQ